MTRFAPASAASLLLGAAGALMQARDTVEGFDGYTGTCKNFTVPDLEKRLCVGQRNPKRHRICSPD